MWNVSCAKFLLVNHTTLSALETQRSWMVKADGHSNLLIHEFTLVWKCLICWKSWRPAHQQASVHQWERVGRMTHSRDFRAWIPFLACSIVPNRHSRLLLNSPPIAFKFRLQLFSNLFIRSNLLICLTWSFNSKFQTVFCAYLGIRWIRLFSEKELQREWDSANSTAMAADYVVKRSCCTAFNQASNLQNSNSFSISNLSSGLEALVLL